MKEGTERKGGGYAFAECSWINLLSVRFLKGEKKPSLA